MKLKYITTGFCLILLSSISFSQNENQIKKIDQYDDKGIKIILFCGDYSFVEQWQKPETPKLITKNTIKRGDDLVPFIVFSSNNLNENGNASLTYDIKVISPDSSTYFDQKNLLLWKDSPSNNLNLVQQYIRIFIEEKDQLGIYTVEVEVTGKNINIVVPLSVNFEVK
ncbi:MAG TPA: hypothetical protein VLH59_14850 [Ignavibacteriaceae bacterium]|nr:hypothetical protein [Ignavibacteriaceae bacterium]